MVSRINGKEGTRFRNSIQYYKLQRKNIYRLVSNLLEEVKVGGGRVKEYLDSKSGCFELSES